ncbi:uncharacterized protein [Macrobrachium rosenbergii]|uniref:uncharacterized protein n=1 Tax=Macrobrachium rosenbergii TaxID=79674 RepID=UPI0034D42BAF
MRWLTLLLVLGLLCQVPPPTSSLELDLDDNVVKSIVDLLTPILGGDVEGALQGFINIGQIGMGVAKFINIISSQVFNVSLADMNFGSYIPMADRKILAMFELLSRRLDQMEHGVHGIANSLRDLTDGMQDMVRWEIALDTMEEYMRPIHTLYKRFLLYQELKDKIEDHTLMDFANQVVSHDTHSIMSLMAHLHSMAVPDASLRSGSPIRSPSDALSSLNNPKDVYFVPKKVPQKVSRTLELKEKRMKGSRSTDEKMGQFLFRPSLFEMLHQAIKSSDKCRLKQSPQQLVNGLHVLISLTEARGYAMLEFAWMILRVYNEGNFTVERDVAQRLYMQYSEDLLKEAHKTLSDEDRDFYQCDPDKHISGDTYVQFTELLQGYIENEVDMNSGGSCTQTCGYYKHTKSEGCYLPTRQYCGQHRRCRGTIHDCKFYDADAWVCLSKNPYRRYDYIKYESGLRLGTMNTCSGTTMKVDSWWRWFVHCSYCLCLCDDGESPTTDRFISLMPAFSDTRNNMVVTGLKFMKKQRVIHIQVQQGEALPQGQVNISSIHWVPVEPINIISTAYQEGTHFKKLSYEDRNIDLDQLSAPEAHVVTGVRFRMLGSHINLEMQVTPVNYTDGKLEPYKSYWVSNDNTPAMANNPRKQFSVDDLDDPTKFPLQNKQDAEPDSWLRFVPTSRGEDVAQLTVPFFDAQNVSPSPSSWLSGIELFHKGQQGSGGFLGLKVFTYDVTQHMETSRDEKVMRYLAPPFTEPINTSLEIDLYTDLEDTVNEHEKGLGVLGYITNFIDKVLHIGLKVMDINTRSSKVQGKIFEAFQVLSNRLDHLEQKVGDVKVSLKRLANELRDVIHWELALDTLEEYARAINTMYDRFILYQGMEEKVENQTILEFVKQVVSHDRYSVSTLMGDLYSMAVPSSSMSSNRDFLQKTSNNKNHNFEKVKIMTNTQERIKRRKRDDILQTSFRSSVFKILQDVMKQTNPCKLEQSPQLLMNGLYVLLAITQARGFVMLEFSWMILRLHNNGNFTTEQEMSEYLYTKYSEDILNEAQKAMADTSRDFFACDPQKHVEGITFIQFREFLQGYLENEADMNSYGTCKQNCAHYQHARHETCYEPDTQLCGKQPRCQGTIRDCQFHEPDAWVCLSESEHRRYDYIRYESGSQFGYNGKCNGTVLKVDSWYRWLLYHCSYCLCICDNEDLLTSERYISLAEVMSNTNDNMVVTGVKFVKINKVIHLVIQQGKALPKGEIDASTVQWMDAAPIDVDSPMYKKNINYKRLSYDERSIDLDRLEGPSNHAVTGVKFRALETHINLQVHVTPIDYASGKLLRANSYWIQNDIFPEARKEIKLQEPSDPTKASPPNRETLESNSYVQFGPTSRRSDVAQLTVPFFDAQEVSLSSPGWLSGIDLYHRGQPGSGGFIGLKLITFNLSEHMLNKRK